MRGLCPALPRGWRSSPPWVCSPRHPPGRAGAAGCSGQDQPYLTLGMGGERAEAHRVLGDCSHSQVERGSPRVGLVKDSGSPLQWDRRAPQTPWQGRRRAALFPSLYLPDNGTIQQVLNVLMGFWIASVAHLPQGHFTPPWEPGPTARKKRPVVCRMNRLLTEAPESQPRSWGALCSPSATLLQAPAPAAPPQGPAPSFIARC